MLPPKSISATLRHLRAGHVTVKDVVEECLQNAAALNPLCNAIVNGVNVRNGNNKANDAATEQRRVAMMSRVNEATIKYQQGTARPLEGIPIVVKDNITTTDYPTSCCSRILHGASASILNPDDVY